MAKKILLGALIFVILTSSFYIMLPEQVKIIFEDTRTVFKVYTGSKYETSAVEYVRVFDGSKKMLADSRANTYLIYEGIDPMTNTIVNFTNVTKTAYMKRDGVRVEQLYHFNGMTEDKAMVPVSERICFYNGSGKIFEWLIKDITYTGVTKDIISPFAFGMNMEVEFQDGYYRAKVYNNLVAPDKIIVRYRIPDDDECYDVRLFDPCVVLSDDTPVTVAVDTVFCAGQDVQINGSATASAITITDHNIDLECNGTRITGNGTRFGIETSGKNSLTLKNCIINNYNRDVNAVGGGDDNIYTNLTIFNFTVIGIILGGDRFIIQNSSFFGNGASVPLYFNGVVHSLARYNNFTYLYGTSTKPAIEFFVQATDKNNTIDNNIFKNTRGISTDQSRNIFITNNEFQNLNSYSLRILSSGANITFINNSVRDGDIEITINNGSDILIKNNSFFNLTTRITTIDIKDYSENVTIIDNKISFQDVGITVKNSTNISIINNIINYSVTNKDGWLSGIRLYRGSNLIDIINNSIDNYGSCGILSMNATRVNIRNNSIEQLSIAEKLAGVIVEFIYLDLYDTTAGICIVQSIKGYNGEDTTSVEGTLVNNQRFNSENFTISGNVFGNNVQTYLKLQGASNITHDLSSFWLWKFKGLDIYNFTSLYNNNLFNRLSIVPTNVSGERFWFTIGYNTSIYDEDRSPLNYSVSKTSLEFNNINSTKIFNVTFNSTINEIKYGLMFGQNTILNERVGCWLGFANTSIGNICGSFLPGIANVTKSNITARYNIFVNMTYGVNHSTSSYTEVNLSNNESFKFRYPGLKDLNINDLDVSFVGTARNVSTAFNLDCPTYLKIKNDLFFDSYNFNAPCNVYIESGGKLHTE